MKKLGIVLCAIGTMFSVNVLAQKVIGNVKDDQGKGLSKATVSLLNAADSSVAKLGVTNTEGNYAIPAKAGKFLISISNVGYATRFSSHFNVEVADITLPQIVLEKNAANLQTVVVTNQKPMIEVKADKTILNIEGTINATGSDALELLRKAPGVLVDKDDNLSLAGKNGVQVYIDGKPSPIAGADLAAYLKTLQAAQIENIEIITNPSAKYEAAGNAGIINIRLKKNKSFGTNGSLNAGYNIGIYGKYNGGISLNHRNKKTNIFGSYNINHSLNQNNFNLYRVQLDTLFDQKSVMKSKNTSNSFKAGMDYFVNSKSTIGVMVNGNISDNDMSNSSSTPISFKPSSTIYRVLQANNETDAKRNNINVNGNYRYVNAGKELNIDADYGAYRIKSNQLQPNVYYNASGTVKQNEYIYRFISPTDIDIYSIKSDYEQDYKKGRLGIGFKTALVNTSNNFGRYDVVNNSSALDLNRSNQFDYKENINALYANYNRPLKGAMIQLGLRMENTNLTGKSYPLNANGSTNYNTQQSFKRNYTNLFPSAAVTFNKNPMNQWGLSYSRRIDRPAYQDLNPFEFKLDEYTFQKGNINLRPQYTNSVSLTNTYKYKLTTSLTYSHVADVFTQLIDTTEKSKSFISKQNLATQDLIAMNISYPIMYKAYSAFVNLSANYSLYKANFGGGNRNINLDVFTYNIYMQHSLKFGKKKNWTGEISGWYNSPTIWQGTFESKQMWTLDAGIQKNIFKGKGNIKLSVSDIFYSMRWKGESNFAGQQTIVSGNWESRMFRSSFTWRFGNNQVKAARQRKSSQDDESKRTQGGGGIGQQ